MSPHPSLYSHLTRAAIITVIVISSHTAEGSGQPRRYRRESRSLRSGSLSYAASHAFSTLNSATYGDISVAGAGYNKAAVGSRSSPAQFLSARAASVSDGAQVALEGDVGRRRDVGLIEQSGVRVLSKPVGSYVVSLPPSGLQYLEFDSSTTDEIKVVTQLLSHRYDSSISSGNCVGYFVSVEIRNKNEMNMSDVGQGGEQHNGNETSGGSSGNRPGSEDGTSEEHERRGGWRAFWNAIATMLDTSNFCELLPMVMLRVEPEPVPQPYVVLLRAQLGVNEGYYRKGKECLVRVFIAPTPKERERRMQNFFALGLPLIILLVTAPFTFMHAHMLRDYLADIDVVFWLIYPSIALRNALVSFLMFIYQRTWGARVQRREELLQRDLEERHRQMMEQTALPVPDLSTRNGDGEGDNPRDEAPDLACPQPQGIGEGRGTSGGAVTTSPYAEQGEARDYNRGQRLREYPPGATSIPMELTSPRTSIGEVGPDTFVALEDMTDVGPNDNDDCNRSNVRRPLISSQKPSPKAAGGANSAGGSFANNSNLYCMRAVEQVKVKPVKPVGADNAQTKTNVQNDNDDDEDERICRICRDDDTEEPLISPCECTGSVRWIHVSCLDKWRIESTKRNARNVNCCEICKKPFHVPISRRALVMKNLKGVSLGALLLLTCIFIFVVVTVGQRVTLGEMTCRAPWHTVSYSTMFDFDGVILTIFLQFMLTMMAAYAFSAVYGCFHTNPETLVYLMTFQTLPPFWTRRNTSMIALIFVGGVLQALALGFLAKFFIYRTSSIVWSWEASPCTGAVLFLGYAAFGTLLSTAIHDWLSRRRQQREEDQIEVHDIVEEVPQQTADVGEQNQSRPQVP